MWPTLPVSCDNFVLCMRFCRHMVSLCNADEIYLLWISLRTFLQTMYISEHYLIDLFDTSMPEQELICWSICFAIILIELNAKKILHSEQKNKWKCGQTWSLQKINKWTAWEIKAGNVEAVIKQGSKECPRDSPVPGYGRPWRQKKARRQVF